MTGIGCDTSLVTDVSTTTDTNVKGGITVVDRCLVWMTGVQNRVVLTEAPARVTSDRKGEAERLVSQERVRAEGYISASHNV